MWARSFGIWLLVGRCARIWCNLLWWQPYGRITINLHLTGKSRLIIKLWLLASEGSSHQFSIYKCIFGSLKLEKSWIHHSTLWVEQVQLHVMWFWRFRVVFFYDISWYFPISKVGIHDWYQELSKCFSWGQSGSSWLGYGYCIHIAQDHSFWVCWVQG